MHCTWQTLILPPKDSLQRDFGLGITARSLHRLRGVVGCGSCQTGSVGGYCNRRWWWCAGLICGTYLQMPSIWIHFGRLHTALCAHFAGGGGWGRRYSLRTHCSTLLGIHALSHSLSVHGCTPVSGFLSLVHNHALTHALLPSVRAILCRHASLGHSIP